MLLLLLAGVIAGPIAIGLALRYRRRVWVWGPLGLLLWPSVLILAQLGRCDQPQPTPDWISWGTRVGILLAWSLFVWLVVQDWLVLQSNVAAWQTQVVATLCEMSGLPAVAHGTSLEVEGTASRIELIEATYPGLVVTLLMAGAVVFIWQGQPYNWLLVPVLIFAGGCLYQSIRLTALVHGLVDGNGRALNMFQFATAGFSVVTMVVGLAWVWACAPEAADRVVSEQQASTDPTG